MPKLAGFVIFHESWSSIAIRLREKNAHQYRHLSLRSAFLALASSNFARSSLISASNAVLLIDFLIHYIKYFWRKDACAQWTWLKARESVVPWALNWTLMVDIMAGQRQTRRQPALDGDGRGASEGVRKRSSKLLGTWHHPRLQQSCLYWSCAGKL